MSIDRASIAVSYFESGFNCAQSVFLAFAEGLERELALRLATGFGGGLGRSGEVCGAVSGAVLAIGLQHGRATLADEGARELTYRLVGELIRQFKEEHGSILCRDLLGLDLGIQKERQRAHDLGLIRQICPGFIRGTVAILDKLEL